MFQAHTEESTLQTEVTSEVLVRVAMIITQASGALSTPSKSAYGLMVKQDITYGGDSISGPASLGYR